MNDEELQRWLIPDTNFDAHEYLRRVYQGVEQPDYQRMKAAIECLPFERPKLSTTAVLIDGSSFAERLQRAMDRSNAIEGPKVIDIEPEEAPRDD
jgi:hypothetical protein